MNFNNPLISPTQIKIDTLNVNQLCSIGVDLMRGNLFAEAYSLLKQCEKTGPHTSLFFNLALCCYRGSDLESAYSYTEKALTELKKKVQGTSITETDTVQERLKEIQKESDGYKQPMSVSFPDFFPESAELSILRLMIDLCAAAGWQSKGMQLATRLKGYNFKNVNELFFN